MRKLSHLYAPFVLCSVLFLGVEPAAIGCGFHAPLQVQLNSMYPGSLPVAVALRKAADKGVIDAAALAAAGKDTANYADTVHRLQSFSKVLAASPTAAELPASFSLGYVESQLWARYSQSDGKIRVDIHTNGPAEGEPVVLTGEPVLLQVLAGKLSLDRALADDLLLIDASESDKADIRNALKTTSMASGISRR